MSSVKARLAGGACMMVAAMAVFAAPSVAGAATKCSGGNIGGQGASVLKIAVQSVWGPDFNTSANADACSGTQGSDEKPIVSYSSTSSGIGLESWGVNKHVAGFEATNAYVGTEEPPNATEKAEIEANETTKVAETVQSIPVAQESVTPIVHLPAGCTATSKTNPGRLVLNNKTLEGIFLGTITTWGQIKDGGDKLSGSGCSASTAITRVVRLDSAGTSHIFKKYLNLVSSTPFETETGSSQNWNELSEGAGNTVWPKAASVMRPAKTGDSALVAKVAETPGSIGYASLADTRANSSFVPPAGGASTGTFWTPVQHNGLGTKATYADPSTNGEVAATANANCKETKYTNGSGTKFPPKSTSDTWSEVTTATTQKHFTLCGIAYVLGLSKYSAYPGTAEGEAVTLNNFLLFVLETGAEGGQVLIANHDYEPVPSTLVKEVREGAGRVAF